MDECEKKVKGRPLIGYFKYVKKKWGADGLMVCEKAVGFKYSDIRDEVWYPRAYSDDIIVWIASTHGRDAVTSAARSMVSEVGVISFAARVAGMDRVLDRAVDEVRASLNFGKVSVKKESGGALVTLRDYCSSEDVCAAWQGILEGVMELTKTRGVVEEVKCQNKGAEACVYRMTWGR